MQAIMNTKLKLWKSQKGMTLIELMAVVVILGILAAVAGAAVTGGFNKSKTSADAASVQVIKDAAQRYVIDNNVADTSLTTVTMGALVSSGYLQSEPTSQADSTKPFFSLAVTKASGQYTYTVTTAAAAQP